MDYKDILFMFFVLISIGLGLTTLVYVVNVRDCNNIIDEGYLVTHKTTFREVNCNVMTKYGISVPTNLLTDMNITKDDYVKVKI